jgi:hypothetical protein
LRRRKPAGHGATAMAGRAPGEPLQRRDARFRPQPGGNGRTEAPPIVALLAKTPGLGVVARLDWRLGAPARVCAHSVNRP